MYVIVLTLLTYREKKKKNKKLRYVDLSDIIRKINVKQS